MTKFTHFSLTKWMEILRFTLRSSSTTCSLFFLGHSKKSRQWTRREKKMSVESVCVRVAIVTDTLTFVIFAAATAGHVGGSGLNEFVMMVPAICRSPTTVPNLTVSEAVDRSEVPHHTLIPSLPIRKRKGDPPTTRQATGRSFSHRPVDVINPPEFPRFRRQWESLRSIADLLVYHLTAPIACITFYKWALLASAFTNLYPSAFHSYFLYDSIFKHQCYRWKF